MRSYFVFAVAASLICGTVASADLVMSSSRLINGDGTDTVVFTVRGTGTNTQPNLVYFDIALNAPTMFGNVSYPDNGLIVHTDDLATSNSGSAVITAGPDSYINLPGGWGSFGQSILNLDGTIDSGLSGTYTDGQKVAGIGGAFGTTDSSSHGVSVTGGLVFAIAIVPTGDPVEVLQTTPAGTVPGNRAVFTDFEPDGTEFMTDTASGDHNYVTVVAVNNATSPFPMAIPEPSSLGLIGWGLAGFLARRRGV